MTEEIDTSIEALYRSNHKRLQALAFRYVQDWEIANEIVQETFVIACAKAEVVLTHENPVGWITQTLKFVAYSNRRKRSKYAQLFLSLDALPAQKEPYSEQELSVEHSLENITTAEEIHLLKRIAIEGATYEELAAELDVKVWTVYKRMQRLARRLREIYEK